MERHLDFGYLTTGLILLEDEHHFIYKIARIDYVKKGNSFRYIFSPYYNVIDIIPNKIFHGIPGIDLSSRESNYVRQNFIPTFISERTPNSTRDDLDEFMEECRMKKQNRLEWLIRTNTRYHGDNLFVADYLEGAYKERTYNLDTIYELGDSMPTINRELLKIVCKGDDIYSPEVTITDENRAYYYNHLMSLYEKDLFNKKDKQSRGIKKAKEKGIYKGRTPLTRINMDDTLKQFSDGVISEAQAIMDLSISRSTFYRRLKNFKDNPDK